MLVYSSGGANNWMTVTNLVNSYYKKSMYHPSFGGTYMIN